MLNSTELALATVYALVGSLLIQAVWSSYRRQPKAWVWHFVTFVSLLASPFLLLFLTTSPLPAGEQPGPGDGLAVMLLFPLWIVYAIYGIIMLLWASVRP
jgi:hypothetical protein